MRCVGFFVERVPLTHRSSTTSRMTQSRRMRLIVACGLLAIPLYSQSIERPAVQESRPQEEYLDIYTEHPRLFLRPQRLRLIRRERERRTMRWLQFETLMAGKAPMPETGFAQALYYQASGEESAGKEAVRWALSPQATDLRQLAIVFDWCQAILTETQAKALIAKLENGIEGSGKKPSIPAVRSSLLAAVALAGHSKAAQARIAWVIREWWRGSIVPAIKGGRNVVPREDTYALLELMHAIRDNLNIDLRDPIPAFFKGLPIFHLLSYYPAAFAAAEGEYRIPSTPEIEEPNLDRATMSRAAELCMVGYDTNAPESQVLQGWLMHDRFLLRGTLGITYEFLWANPYQPGLSYYHVPLVFHDDMFGRLYIRSSWEESAKWLGYVDGRVQLFEDGQPSVRRPELSQAPLSLTEAVVLFGDYARKFKITLTDEEDLFVVGLKPRQAHDVEVSDQEIVEVKSDPGGILPLKLPRKTEVEVRIRTVSPLVPPVLPKR